MWRAVPSNPDYAVSDKGEVRRVGGRRRGARIGRMLKPYAIGSYPGVTLCSPYGDEKKYLHALVAEAFLGPTPIGMVIHHKDNNRNNPCLDNLEFATQGENVKAGYKHWDTDLKGENAGRVRLKERQVLEIRERYADGESQRRLAAVFDMSRGAIASIVTGRSWAHLGGRVVRQRAPIRMPLAAERIERARSREDEVLAIRARYAMGESQRVLAAAFGLTPQTIYQIVTGRTWAYLGGPVIRRKVPKFTPHVVRKRLLGKGRRLCG